MRVTLCVLALCTSIVAGSAGAAPVVIQMVGEGMRSGIPDVVPIEVTLTIDDARPDENPSPGDYLATNYGAVVVVSGSTVEATASLIATDALAGTWTLEVTTVEQSIEADTQIIFTGLGLTPDQIVPDFDSITSGVWTTSIPPLADVVGTIAIVPEPSTALLLGLGLVGASLRRRTRR